SSSLLLKIFWAFSSLRNAAVSLASNWLWMSGWTAYPFCFSHRTVSMSEVSLRVPSARSRTNQVGDTTSRPIVLETCWRIVSGLALPFQDQNCSLRLLSHSTSSCRVTTDEFAYFFA